MLEKIPGYDKWLDPPREAVHSEDCPLHEDKDPNEDDVCLCKELSEIEYEESVERRLSKEG